MLETLAGWNEDIAEGVFAFEETVERSTNAIISPGCVTRSICLTTYNWSSAQLCLLDSLQIPSIWGSSSIAHSSMRSYQRQLGQQGNTGCLEGSVETSPGAA
jgi:hypothetical protein